jgi:hypothetical protein
MKKLQYLTGVGGKNGFSKVGMISPWQVISAM